ncbi:unnamed protein product [Caenorhabditis angaria]|uniref:Anaphase-promoting complex subunit 4 WD40 domain-containing protein n=1 Tax=Caenorhabditis angaria TaxID=860376 RepID=A0A9P1ITH8_9PELO|nr:unnamed protein product [Caenorhabditis angaria]
MEPVFRHFGVRNGANCIFLSEDSIIIGSAMGDVEILDTETFLKISTVYSDPEMRACQSIYLSSSGRLCIQIRNFGILIFQNISGKQWEEVQFIEMNHVGFCNFLIFEEKLIYVSQNSKGRSIICCEDGRKLEIDEVTPMHLSSFSDRIILGSEDGKIRIIQDFKVISEIQPVKDTVFCTSVNENGEIACGYSKSPIIIIRNDFSTSDFEELHYPQTSSGCSSLQFSPNSKQLLAGFWDGTIRVFSIQKLKILLVISNAHSNTVTGLVWKNKRECLSCSTDSTIAVWNFEK